jgi:[CysO sulfur-carrier protein]-S-L-cysteine hydrolase
VTLSISRAAYDQIVAHARRDHPIEACGVLDGPDGRAERAVPMTNAAGLEDYFTFDPAEQLRVWRSLVGEAPVAIYHSHTGSPAYPSATDVEWAQDPGLHYVLYSTRDDELRSYRILDGEISEEAVEIT